VAFLKTIVQSHAPKSKQQNPINIQSIVSYNAPKTYPELDFVAKYLNERNPALNDDQIKQIQEKIDLSTVYTPKMSIVQEVFISYESY